MKELTYSFTIWFGKVAPLTTSVFNTIRPKSSDTSRVSGWAISKETNVLFTPLCSIFLAEITVFFLNSVDVVEKEISSCPVKLRMNLAYDSYTDKAGRRIIEG